MSSTPTREILQDRRSRLQRLALQFNLQPSFLIQVKLDMLSDDKSAPFALFSQTNMRQIREGSIARDLVGNAEPLVERAAALSGWDGKESSIEPMPRLLKRHARGVAAC